MGKTIFADRAYIDKALEEHKFALVEYFNSRFETMERDILEILNAKTETSTPEPEKPQERQNKAVRRDAEEEPEWMIWKMAMSRKVGQIVKQYPTCFENGNNLLKRIYQKMNNVYGFVADQERKPYRDTVKADNKRITVLEVIAYSPQWRSIFESVLDNMAEEARIRIEKEKAVDAENLSRPHQEIIQPLIDARGDRSIYGCATYSIVISRMKKHGLDLDAEKAAYQARNGLKRKIRNSEIIEGDLGIKRKFIEAVTEIMCEMKAS